MYNLVVLPESIVRRYIWGGNIPLHPHTQDMAALVELRDGRSHVCEIANSIYIVAASGFADGIPFGAEDIVAIKRTAKRVDLDTLRERYKQIDATSLGEAMVHNRLAPGNYEK